MVSQQSAFSVLRDGECQNWILQLTYDRKKKFYHAVFIRNNDSVNEAKEFEGDVYGTGH